MRAGIGYSTAGPAQVAALRGNDTQLDAKTDEQQEFSSTPLYRESAEVFSQMHSPAGALSTHHTW